METVVQETGLEGPASPSLPESLTNVDVDRRSLDINIFGLPSASECAPETNRTTSTVGLEKAIECLSVRLAQEHPKCCYIPKIPFPPFQDKSGLPDGILFFAPRCANDGPSSEFLQAEPERDMTPRNLL